MCSSSGGCPHQRDQLSTNVGDGLNKALAALKEANAGLEGVLHPIDFTRTVGKSKLPDRKLLELIAHFNRSRLLNDDFEFPDLLGAAYKYLIHEFADSAGKKGVEFHTPRPAVRLMVRIADPKEGQRVDDPCCGSGGILILSVQHLQEPRDTLVEPLHTEGGELMRFDRVITNPPFSQNYSQDGLPYKERLPYGYCPESGKKADLMFVQHTVSVLRASGLVAFFHRYYLIQKLPARPLFYMLEGIILLVRITQ